jgi:enamine deaminase RidA (YjgF/YER057c/UK114 family)
MDTDVRTIQSTDSQDIYLTAVPSANLPPRDQAEQVFAWVREVLAKAGARLLEERVFATDAALESLGPLRAAAYGDLDDGVSPTWLSVPRGMWGEMAGIQVHAVRGATAPEPLGKPGAACGRVLNATGHTIVSLAGVVAPEAGSDPSVQARAVFEKAEACLGRVGADMKAVARTWLWLGDILAWYGDFNQVRNRFYNERGLLDGHSKAHCPPASTGIGVRPAGGSHLALDVLAIVGDRVILRHVGAAGNQQSPYDYGSAFSRATSAVTPAGETVYVSGTASIDADGNTQHVGDAEAQIQLTIDQVRAVLRDVNCTDDDVVQAIAYSKTAEVEKLVAETWKGLSWPRLSLIADVCRDELLFELEVTACRGARPAKA